MPKKKTRLPTEIKPSPVAYKKTKEDVARQRKYEAEDAMRTITRADEIRSNPRLMKDVKNLAKEQVTSLKKFCK